MNKKIKKIDILILAITIVLLLIIGAFCIFNWEVVIKIFDLVVEGKEIVQDYILQLGIPGVIAIGIILIICFFFPFISSLPVQIACLMAYGIVDATILIGASLAIASQLLYLFERNLKTFCYTKKQIKKQQEVEARIKNSKINIHLVMIILYIVPFIPFLIISSIASRSNMKWWKYALYTSLGPVPEIIVTLLLGNAVISNTQPVVSVLILIFMITFVVLSLIFKDKLIYLVFRPREKKHE